MQSSVIMNSKLAFHGKIVIKEFDSLDMVHKEKTKTVTSQFKIGLRCWSAGSAPTEDLKFYRVSSKQARPKA